ncbi:MAG: hypothetical protein IJA25_08470 [Anaerotignum sp.]|nr:hypothetical protein [Anaerotignum sp.]
MADYMKTLWEQFYGFVPSDVETEELRRSLSGQLTKEQRRLLLRIVDRKDLYCERVSQESFMAGFRLAWGIAGELIENKF